MRVPRIRVRPCQRADSVYAQRHVGQIGPTDRYSPGSEHTFDDRCICWHHRLCQRRHPPGGGQADMSIFSFTVRGTPCRGPGTPAASLLSASRAGACLVSQNSDHGVQRRVHSINASQVGTTTSIELSCRRAMRCANSVAESCQISLMSGSE